ncbi:A/G-specific adenine glycosylase [Arthrobacter sp. I2-34]|uniref:Adenine DNA glycosylase n=1 Tax=Arthrobacter hankyongi TaxID=2904801 RepID=A0ABS9LC48_9MICC|nr:A/G-specific adenine glycosylase [Arthrobacter hankyongi]MCG2624250.1 A/G-specific adenine glycosylase [Arthrobacter hankyongi]
MPKTTLTESAAPQSAVPVADAGLLHHRIAGWFEANARRLPWREPDCSPWGIMVSEFMLQQTPVSRVLPVWEQWLERWPEPAALAAAPSGEAVRAWGRLGYPRRALRLHAAATAIVAGHAGAVPGSYAELLKLPGVGTYTAAAIASFAFDAPETVVDTNVRRVHARLVGGEALPAPSLTAGEMRRAQALMPDPAGARTWNAGVMELGALVCTARSPKCGQCPVLDACAWVAAGRPEPRYVPKGQAWAGTDRQVRGAMMAVLRHATGPVLPELLLGSVDLVAAGQPEHPGGLGAELRRLQALNASDEQLARCLDGLLADGLAEASAGGVALPA